ncbi:MAG: hypothetical protein AB8B91_21840 [Rubripirellula sp.]
MTNLRYFVSPMLLLALAMTAQAHHPERECQPVSPRVDVIPPLGTNLRMSHRRKYNRPHNVTGKIAYYIAPSSQEAMAWHNAQHKGYYKNDSPRMVTHYFSPKPWEALRIGARRSQTAAEQAEPAIDSHVDEADSMDLSDSAQFPPLMVEGLIES